MRKTLSAGINQSSKHVWIYLNKLQNTDELLLSSVWNWLKMAMVLIIPE